MTEFFITVFLTGSLFISRPKKCNGKFSIKVGFMLLFSSLYCYLFLNSIATNYILIADKFEAVLTVYIPMALAIVFYFLIKKMLTIQSSKE